MTRRADESRLVATRPKRRRADSAAGRREGRRDLARRLEGNRRAAYVGDPQRVQQILTNLLSNAVKFTPAGGTVSVRCASASAASEWRAGRRRGLDVDHRRRTPASESRATISTASSIPFVQVEDGYTRVHGGTGLGLTISRVSPR